MRAIINFFRTVVDAYRTGRRQYFLHNLSCRYDWVWAISCYRRGDMAWNDCVNAILSPTLAKSMRKQACDDIVQQNQDFLAVYNEHNDHTLSDGINHFLGECEGEAGGCSFCVDEWVAHSSGQCDDECPMCDWTSKGYVYENGRWKRPTAP